MVLKTAKNLFIKQFIKIFIHHVKRNTMFAYFFVRLLAVQTIIQFFGYILSGHKQWHLLI